MKRYKIMGLTLGLVSVTVLLFHCILYAQDGVRIMADEGVSLAADGTSTTVTPEIRYNALTSTWQYSNDGLTFTDFAEPAVLTESDPIYAASFANGITNAAAGRTLLELGSLATLNAETDPVYAGSFASGITDAATGRTLLELGSLATLNAEIDPIYAASFASGITNAATGRTSLELGGLATLSVVSGGVGGTITDLSITNDDISDTAAIDGSKISGWNATNWDSAYSESRYSNASPTPVAIGGISAGITFTNQTMQQMWDALLYPYQAPAFASFSSALFTTFEVGDSLPTSTTLSYSVSNPGNIGTQPPPVGVLSTNITGASFVPESPFTLAGSGSITMNIPGGTTLNEPDTRSVTISGTNSQGATFTRSGTITWKYKRYSGMSPNPTLTDAQIRALTNNEFADSRAQSKSFSTSTVGGEYVYFAWPAVFDPAGNPPNFITPLGELSFNPPTTSTSINNYSLPILYNIYRTTDTLMELTITSID